MNPAQGRLPLAGGGGKTALLYTDGASRGNPGASGWGAALIDSASGEVIAEACGPLPDTTNNVAEYTAVIEGLKLAHRHGVGKLELRADSLLLIMQLLGKYKIKAPHLVPLAAEARKLLAKFDGWSAVHVPREQNGRADRQANLGADEAQRLYHGRR